MNIESLMKKIKKALHKTASEILTLAYIVVMAVMVLAGDGREGRPW